MTFFWNKYWTFKSQNGSVIKELSIFFCISLIGVVLSLALIYLSLNQLNLSLLTGKTLSVALVFLWNFTANSTFNFKQR
ncbi:hypothetical protein DN752_17385 [Echinicola strongylocentroti]|uniref:GtrA/DPMS transmembrane domain-containing protein n=1 Tax=Echinicola strongylocentroti TaxID=1795355 RepID=A0A2Z4IMD5_9BACT|nr:hypothetical protein DN752_17385 [Echinicola strongylocentroti]